MDCGLSAELFTPAQQVVTSTATQEDIKRQMQENIYEGVPGKGGKLSDGTWWTNCTASVGEICTVQYYWRKIVDGKYWASDKRSECVEASNFGGRPFRRWKELPPTEYRPCVCHANHSLSYE